MPTLPTLTTTLQDRREFLVRSLISEAVIEKSVEYTEALISAYEQLGGDHEPDAHHWVAFKVYDGTPTGSGVILHSEQKAVYSCYCGFKKFTYYNQPDYITNFDYLCKTQ